MKVLSNICRIILAVVFIFSGFVKGIDPLGSVYKFADYFTAFHLTGFDFLTYFAAFAVSLIEFLIGIALLIRFHLKTAATAALVVMCFFTPLTLYIALANPVSDCGCFGDAFVISNLHTFIKNVVLLAAAWCVWSRRRELKDNTYFLPKCALWVLCGGILFGVQLWGVKRLPLIDFRPYAIGNNIHTQPTAANNGEKITLIYRNLKTGALESFDETNISWQDSLTYEYVETVIPNDNPSAIHGFTIFHPELDDISEEILTDDNYTYLIISQNLAEVDSAEFVKINQMAKYALSMGYNVYGVTASSQEDVERFANAHQIQFAFCLADETELKTMIRSNPGVIIMRNGTIIDKWSGRDVPSVEEYSKYEPLSYSLSYFKNIYNKLIITILVLLAILLLYKRSKRKQA